MVMTLRTRTRRRRLRRARPDRHPSSRTDRAPAAARARRGRRPRHRRARPARHGRSWSRRASRPPAGNPFYLHELLLALREDRGLDAQQLAERARGAGAGRGRTDRCASGSAGWARRPAALARAVAILGDDAPLRHAARLAGLTVDAAAAAADALAAVEILLAREPLRFVHPLVRQAITRDIPASERASRHLDAARLLDADGAGKERIASHLLLGRAEGDEWVVERAAAPPRSEARRASGPAVGRELPAARARGATTAAVARAYGPRRAGHRRGNGRTARPRPSISPSRSP